MKILFDNVLIDAAISTGDASANYPISNIVHAFLRKRYQSVGTDYDTIYITLASVTAINCFFVSYSNTTQIVVRFYNASSTLLRTDILYGAANNKRYTTDGNLRVLTDGDIRITQEASDEDSDATHFDSIDVKKIEIDVYGASGTYIGGIAAGEAEDFGDPMSPWEEPYIDNSIVTASPYGQTLQQQIDPLRSYSWMIRDLTRDETNEIRDIYYMYGYGARIWIDPFEDDHEFMLPFYSRLDAPPRIVKNGRRYDIEWQFREAR